MSHVCKHPVLLIGSFPFSTVDEVFDVAGSTLSSHAGRFPDGEAQGWVTFPGKVLANTKGVERSGRVFQNQPELPAYELFRLSPGATPEEVVFPRTGYADIAKRSYDRFRQKREGGIVPAGARFQLSLPTPFGVVAYHLVPEDLPALLPAFERTYLAEVNEIIDAIPADDLAVQWDVAIEIVSALHGFMPGLRERAPMRMIVDALARAAAHVPEPVELGFHFCYGNPGGHHIIEPQDTGLMVDLANAVTLAVSRPVTWMHMPVPIDRTDDSYFAPLARLELREDTELFLGLVHLADGIDGAGRRIAAAKKFRSEFGVGFECGLRYFAPDSIPRLLELHVEAGRHACAC